MNAPGNSILIIALLAVFVACCGYAAGRVHQRRQGGHDREEAYRHGYETATRRVFSLAARVIGPRRSGARGSAVGESGPVPVPVPVPGPGPGPSEAVPPASSPRSEAGPAPVASVAGAAGMADLGFPVPVPPPSGTVPEPSAVGGVSYQPFPDPREGGETMVLPDIRDLIGGAEAVSGHRVPRPSRPTSPTAGAASAPGPLVSAAAPAPADADAAGSRPAGHRAAENEDDDAIGAVPDAVTSSGRHTVPDELVRAATYRLPPDRIFRAKVRDSRDQPEDPTTRLVPKPRQS